MGQCAFSHVCLVIFSSFPRCTLRCRGGTLQRQYLFQTQLLVGLGELHWWEVRGDPAPSGRGAAAVGDVCGPWEVTQGGPGSPVPVGTCLPCPYSPWRWCSMKLPGAATTVCRICCRKPFALARLILPCCSLVCDTSSSAQRSRKTVYSFFAE